MLDSDEADRFMQLGFGEPIGSILSILEKRRKLLKKGVKAEEWKSEVPLPKRILSMLCLAMINASGQCHANISLRRGLYIKTQIGYDDGSGGSKSEKKGFLGSGMGVTELCCGSSKVEDSGVYPDTQDGSCTIDCQPKGSKAFFSCLDLVCFHFQLFYGLFRHSSGQY